MIKSSMKKQLGAYNLMSYPINIGYYAYRSTQDMKIRAVIIFFNIFSLTRLEIMYFNKNNFITVYNAQAIWLTISLA